MTLTEKELNHLAKLSKLELSEQEKEKFLNGIDEIVNFLGELDTWELEAEDLEEKSEIQPFADQEAFDNPASLLSNSIHKKGEYLSVKTSL